MDIRKLVFDRTNCSFAGPITEVEAPGLAVQYDGSSAVIRADTIPAKARGYMLLAKAIAEGKQTLQISQSPAFKLVGTMLDMSRNGVMKVASVKKYLEEMVILGMNTLMLYTEDTYEVPEYPFFGYQRGRYTLEELREIDDYAFELGIEVIPCIQTFGHLEHFLRFPASQELANNQKVLLADSEKTYDFIRACVAAVRKAFRSNRIHIGCDETHGLELDKYYQLHGTQDKFSVFNRHVSRVVQVCKEFGYQPMMWSDMFFTMADPNRTKDYAPHIQIPQYVIDTMPECDMVFWDYYNLDNDFYRINIEKHKTFRRPVLFAGGIWTWDGFVPYFTHTYNTMKPALEECLRGGVDSVFATLWSNDGCETSHFLANPMLAMFSEYCWLGESCTQEVIWDLAAFLTGVTQEMAEAVDELFFHYTGAMRAGKNTLWSDPLINFLYMDYDPEHGIRCLQNGLSVLERYADHPDTPYYRAVLQASLDKCILHTQLQKRYKAGDRAWLQNYAEKDLPKVIANFETLYQLHHTMWHKDYKTHGFEVLMYRYAGAIERLKYCAHVITQYLNGEIPVIEELEPETLQTPMQPWHSAPEFMFIP